MRPFKLFAYSLVLGLAACGGNGGGDSQSGTSTSVSRSPVPPQTPLVYSGATTGATVSATSAGAISADVIGSAAAGVGGGLLAGVSAQTDYAPDPQPTGATGLARRLAKAIRGDELGRASASSALAGATINQSTPCDSGSINISGTVADNTFTGTVSVDYVDCRTGSDTLNGPASLTIAAYDQTNRIVTDGTLSFTRVRFTGPGFNSDLTGTLRTQVSVGSATETLTQNVTVQDNSTMRMLRTEDLRITNVYSTVTAPTFFTESVSGRVFDSVAGYVDVSTETAPYTAPWGPLYFATSTQTFPDWGIINLAGAAGRARITAIGVDLAKVEVDANGDGIYENSARMRWSDLATAVGANLADSDGDGMHDSWETAKGLNPSVNDASADPDGDGFSNLTEYLAGTDPITNGSIPGPVRHLWVTNVRDLGVDADGQHIDVFVGGSGSGVQLDTITRELGAPFSGVAEPNGSSNRTVTDAQGRVFTLSQGASPTTWIITSSTGTSLTINNVGGTDAGSLIRYGARGLAFRTVGTASPGYIYLVESTQLIP